MNLFLCSNFKFLAPKFLSRFFDFSRRYKCLFIGYADEDKDFYSESTVKFLNELDFDVVCLDECFKSVENFDMIYVKGGNTTQLLHYLKKYNQFEMVKTMVEQGVLFAGQSAGAIVAGSDTGWTLNSEPYDIDIRKIFGKNALFGFGFLNKIIFVHASRYRFPVSAEMENAGRNDFKVSNKFFYSAYLKERKRNQDKNFIVLKDNEAFLKNGDVEEFVRINWSKYPVLEEYRLF